MLYISDGTYSIWWLTEKKHKGWEESRMTLRQLAWANCVSFSTVGEFRRNGSTSRRGEGSDFGVAFIANEEPVSHPKDKYPAVTVVLELRRLIWTERTDFRVISKQVEVEGQVMIHFAQKCCVEQRFCTAGMGKGFMGVSLPENIRGLT